MPAAAPPPLATFAPGLFRDRTVLVTGGTSGIGLACARAFRNLGASVTAVGATQAEADRAASDPANGGIAFAELDVRDAAAVPALVGALVRLDVVVNAAGVIRRDAEHDPAVFADVIAINLTGTMQVCAAARARLAESGGVVVNVASMLTFFGSPRSPAYSASKGGIGQLTKSLAAAWAPDGIRVNAVAPGWIATRSRRPCRTIPSAAARSCRAPPWAAGARRTRSRRARCSWPRPAARFVTGAILAIDGGYLTL
jgi:NAD(P)-dependent dehydrogenase (short-subunit alcohol dehydrogenase family)